MERRILAAIIGSAFAARALAIWISRPELIGWFNHSYPAAFSCQGCQGASRTFCPRSSDPVAAAYANGVPMGGDLRAKPRGEPEFRVSAIQERAWSSPIWVVPR